MANLDLTVTLESKTCYFGHFWAAPHWARPVHCPYCAGDQMVRVQRERDAAYKALSNLRGQITKLKKARRG